MKRPLSMVAEFDGITIQVELPELTPDYEGEITDDMIDRAVSAMSAHLGQMSDVYIDGEHNEPARVHVEMWDCDDADKWHIE